MIHYAETATATYHLVDVPLLLRELEPDQVHDFVGKLNKPLAIQLLRQKSAQQCDWRSTGYLQHLSFCAATLSQRWPAGGPWQVWLKKKVRLIIHKEGDVGRTSLLLKQGDVVVERLPLPPRADTHEAEHGVGIGKTVDDGRSTNNQFPRRLSGQLSHTYPVKHHLYSLLIFETAREAPVSNVRI